MSNTADDSIKYSPHRLESTAPMTDREKVLAKFPATCTVHWPSGPVHACDLHASQLVGLAKFMGAHVGVTAAQDNSECGNCKNEQHSKEA